MWSKILKCFSGGGQSDIASQIRCSSNTSICQEVLGWKCNLLWSSRNVLIKKTLERLWCIFRHNVFAQLFCLFPSMHFCRCKCIRLLCLMSMLEFVKYSVNHIWGCWRSYLQSFGLGSFCHFCRTPSSKNAFQWKQCPRLDSKARMPEILCASFHFEAKVDFARQEVVVEVRMQAEMFALLEATKLPLDVDFFLTSRLGNWFMDLLMYGMLLWP